MAGILEGKRTIARIHDAIEESYKLPAGYVAAHEGVQLAADGGGTRVGGSESAERGLQIGHEQSGRDSFTHHIADANGEPVFIERQHIVIIAADGASRLPGSGHLH